MDSVTLDKTQELLKEIDELIKNEVYEEAAQKIDEHRLFLQKNADMKSQNLLNKNYAKCMFHIIRDAYSEERDEKKFKTLFEKNRSLIELHHSKADYLYLVKIDDRLKRKKKRKVLTLVSVVVIFMLIGGAMALRSSMSSLSAMLPFGHEDKDVSLEHKEESVEADPKRQTEEEQSEDSLPKESDDRVYAQEPEEIEAEEEPIFPEDEYVLDSWSHLLTLEEVQDMTAEQIRMAVNEIYARHGHCFRGPNQEYFESKSWYVAADPVKTEQEITQSFSDIERRNMAFLLQRERFLKGR